MTADGDIAHRLSSPAPLPLSNQGKTAKKSVNSGLRLRYASLVETHLQAMLTRHRFSHIFDATWMTPG